MTTIAPSVTYTQLLRNNRNFRWLWGGQIISLLGDWFNLIATASLLSSLSGSGAAIGSLFVVRMLAPFIISPFAGVVADRYNRKHILIFTDVVRAVTVLGFLFVRTSEQVWLLYALTAIQLGVGGFFFPTKNAILPDIVSEEELGAANTLSSATWSTMLAIGAALGGLVAGLWGNQPAFILDSATFVLSGLCIAKISYEVSAENKQSDKSVSAAYQQYLDGLSYLRNHRDQFVITLLKGTNAIFISTGFQVIQVILGEQVFRMGEGGGISMGLLFGTAGVGTGLGPILARAYAKDDDRTMRWAISLGWVIASVGILIVSTLANFPIVLLGTFLRGFGGSIIWVFSTQLLLQLVPGHIRGRIFATEYMIFTLLSAIGAGVIGNAIDGSLGMVGVMRIMAIGVLVPAVLWLVWSIYYANSGDSAEIIAHE